MALQCSINSVGIFSHLNFLKLRIKVSHCVRLVVGIHITARLINERRLKMFRFPWNIAAIMNPPVYRKPASAGQILFRGAVVMMAIGAVGGWMIGHGKSHDNDLLQDTGPVVLAMRNIGQLHTASYTVKDVVHEDTHAELADWAQAIPGAESVVQSVTHNQALIVSQGTVEAGIDMAKLSDKDIKTVTLPDGKVGLVVHLPPVEVYPASINSHVENMRYGLFWRDSNIVPKAEALAARRFADAAEKENIREKAQVGAIDSLQKLMTSLKRTDVKFYF